MDSKIKEALIDIVGPDNFTDSLIDRVSFSYDSSGLSRRPAAAVWIENTGQVAEVLKLANKHKLPVTPRGAGTSLTGSAVPEEGGLVMDMSRMDAILKISIEDRQVVVQPGVVFDELNQALAPFGFFFPPNPASGKVSTIGGNVATNAGGIKGAKYGTTRDYVLDLEVVLPTGEVLHTGSHTMKCVSGYDLTRLFVGSEGTLGVVTEITLKINPTPQATTTCSATFADLPQAGEAVSEIMRSGIIPSVLELIDSANLQAVNQATDFDLPEVAAMLLVETDGYTQEEADRQMDRIVEALQNNNVLAEDLVVPISKVAETLAGILDIGERHNILIATVAHAGDGNIHPVMVYDGTDPDEVERVKQVETDLFKLALDLGGTLTGEHGVGIAKAEYMNQEHDPVFMQVMNGIKKLLDPNAILNPGKLGLEV